MDEEGVQKLVNALSELKKLQGRWSVALLVRLFHPVTSA